MFIFTEFRKITVREIVATGIDGPHSLSSFGYMIYALLVPVFSWPFQKLSVLLNELENYQTDVDYEDALVCKRLIFETFNNFTAPFLVSFLKKPLFNDCINGNCIEDIRELLICIFLLRYFLLFMGLMVPWGTMTFLSERDPPGDTSVQDEVDRETHDFHFYGNEISRGENPGIFLCLSITCFLLCHALMPLYMFTFTRPYE